MEKATTLHVEIRLAQACHNDSTSIQASIKAWLKSDLLHLFLGQVIDKFPGLSYAAFIDKIEIVDFTGELADAGGWSVQDVEFKMFPYSLMDDLVEEPESQVESTTEEALSLRVSLLPSSTLEEQWSSLVFDPPIAQPLVRFLRRMMIMAKKPRLNASKMNFNKVILLYGPPGTGKSTLCRGLAQKLSIRLSSDYAYVKLVEVSGQSLLSKYFSESGKLVKKVFDRIEMLAGNANVLVCVLIDEVETITGSREKSLNSNECSDALRATNQLLTALDRLRNLPNVAVFCTSNLLTTIDSAFLDRVDLKQFVSNPGPAARYEILRSCINELMSSGIIEDEEAERQEWAEIMHGNNSDVEMLQDSEGLQSLPDALYTRTMYEECPETTESKVWELALRSEGISGRTLSRMPFIAIAMHLSEDTCSLKQAVTALSKTVDEELVLRERTRSSA